MPKKHSLNRHTAFYQSQVLSFLTAEIMTYTFKLSNHIKYEKCKFGDFLFSLPKGKGFSLKKLKPAIWSKDKAASLFNIHNKVVQTFSFPIKIFYSRILYLIYL